VGKGKNKQRRRERSRARREAALCGSAQGAPAEPQGDLGVDYESPITLAQLNGTQGAPEEPQGEPEDGPDRAGNRTVP